MRYNLCVMALLALVLIFQPLSADDSTASSQGNPMLTFRTDCDSVRILCGDVDKYWNLTTTEGYDTSNIKMRVPIAFLSNLDTLVVTFEEGYVDILMTSPTDTVYETIHFVDRFRELLRTYKDFGHAGISSSEGFYYVDPDDEMLTRFRTEYNLDSIAGNGGEIERIINLMRWAHTIVRHDGNSANPSPRTALNLIKVCRDKDRGVNCRMMATILNEAYLAEGFKARFVTCLPYDTTDTDCHVTNMVFSEKLDKWIYMDPTFEAYFMDEDSILLGHMEVRQRMIDGRPLLLPDGMDWNGQPYDQRRYLDYMGKNLFRFGCPMGSEAGYESKEGDRSWIRLNPAGYAEDKVGVADTSGEAGSQAIFYYTDNADFFWAKP